MFNPANDFGHIQEDYNQRADLKEMYSIFGRSNGTTYGRSVFPFFMSETGNNLVSMGCFREDLLQSLLQKEKTESYWESVFNMKNVYEMKVT